MDDYLKAFREMISLRGLTDHTITSYSTYIRTYLDYLNSFLHKTPEEVTWQELREFVLWLKQQRGLSDRTINHCISQLRFFTLYVIHKPWDPYQLPMRKFDTFLPFVPSKQEVWQFISTMPERKQKTMTALMYSSGLRIGEVCNLKCQDIEHSRMRIHITHGKNRSDRYVPLSEHAWLLILDYWHQCGRPRDWLFPKQRDVSKPIDTFFLSRHIHNHEARLGLKHQLSCHSFRHAYATHLYENGTDLLTIKTLMGHKSISSTAIYVDLASVPTLQAISPFDQMGGDSRA